MVQVRRHSVRLAGLCLGLVILGQVFSVALPPTPLAEADSTQVLNTNSPELSVTLSAEPAVANPGDTVTYTVLVANLGAEAATNLEAWSYLPDDLDVLLPGPGFNLEGRMLSIAWPSLPPGVSLSGQFTAELAGLPAGVLTNTITLEADGLENPVQASNGVVVPAPLPEVTIIPAEGGDLATTDGRLDITFPPGWNDEPAEVSYTPVEWHTLEEENGLALHFELEANEISASGVLTPVHSFSAPLTVTVSLTGLLDVAELADSLYWAYQDETGALVYVPIAAVDTTTGQVTVQLDHFSGHYVGSGSGDEGWRLLFNDPTVSLFNGSLNYQIPIEVPPGRNGLQPQVTLSYNSSRVDGLLDWTQADWVGLGWSLDGAEIVRKNVQLCPGGLDNDVCWDDATSSPDTTERFMLTLNGSTYTLVPQTAGQSSGRYYTEQLSGLYLERCNDDVNPLTPFCQAGGGTGTGGSPANYTKEFWMVVTENGTQYRLGFNADSEQVVGPKAGGVWSNVYTGYYSDSLVYRWRIDQVKDVYGNRMVYTYTESPAGNWTKASYLTTIAYAEATVGAGDWQYRLNFQRAARSAYFDSATCDDGNEPTDPHLFFQSEILRSIQAQRRQTDGSYTTIKEYVPHYYCYEKPGRYDDRVLSSLVTYGLGGESVNQDLPATTFTYQQLANRNADCTVDPTSRSRPFYRLNQINNGYGGVTTIVYEKDATQYNRETCTDGEAQDWYNYHVKSRATADGLGHTATTDYIYSGACYGTRDNPDYTWCNPGYEGPLVGFDTATETRRDYDNTVIQYVNHNFLTSEFREGRESLTEVKEDLNGALLQKVSQSWSDMDAECPETGSPTGGAVHFVCLTAKESYTYDPVYQTRSTGVKEKYTYDPVYQGGRQWGRPTTVEFFSITDGVPATTPYRRAITGYQDNDAAGVWLLVPYQESLHDASWALQRATLYLYDGQLDPDAQTLTRGQLNWTLAVNVVGAAPATWEAVATEQRYYTGGVKEGLLWKTLNYSSYATVPITVNPNSWGTVTTPGDWRSIVEVGYTSDGLNLLWQSKQGVGVTSQVTDYTYNSNYPWLPATVSDPNDVVTEYRYDDFGRLTKVIRPGASDTDPTIWYKYWDDYDTAGGVKFLSPLLIETVYQSNVQQGQRQFYDGLGRLVQTQQAHAELAGGLDQDALVTYSYDARGLTTCQTVPYGVNPYYWTGSTPYKSHNCTDATYDQTTTTYDAAGRVTAVTGPDDQTTATTLIVPGDWTGITNVNRGAWQQKVVNPNNDVTLYTYDAYGRLDWVGQKDDGGWCNALQVTTYDYDVLDNLKTVTRGGYVCGTTYTPGAVLTQMTYDALGRKLDMTDPDMGRWDYTYDVAGNMLTQTDAIQPVRQKICFRYDSFNRLTVRFKDSIPGDPCPTNIPAADHLATYIYDTALHGLGQLALVSWGPTGGNQDTFEYDAEGHLQKQTRLVDNRSYELSNFTYDALDRPVSVTYPGGEVVTTGYNNQGLPETLIGSSTYVTAATYNARGQMALLDRPSPVPDTSYTYHPAVDITGGGLGDANFRLATMTAGSLLNFSYQYDKVGNVTQITDTAVTPNDTQDFTYDHLGRLLTAAGTQPAYNHTYTYSLTGGQALGNISNRTESGTVYSYVYSASQRQAVTQLWQGLNQIGAYGYDANGNMTTRNDNEGNFTQVFDVENRLVSVTNNVVEEVTTFTYDANGQRVKTIKPDGTVMYSPFPFYEEYVPTLQTTVVQPGTSGEDAYVYNGQPSTNYGSSTALVVGYEDVDTYFWRSFLRFDLSAVPAGAAVTEATLTLVCAYTLGSDPYATLNLYPASATWVENSVTWANQPGRNATPIANDKIDNASYVAYDFTVTDFVQDWLAGTTANHGFRLEVTQTAAASGKVNCRSSDYSTASLRPKLTVSWYPQETPFVRSYYSLGGQTIALRKVGGDSPGLYYLYADHLGSTQRLSTSTGSPVLGSDARFLPFGKYRIVPTAGLTDRGFTGHLHNDPIGLVYMNARYYVPAIGRFASADTIIPNPKNPQAYNRYGYGFNNPVKYRDPSGHFACAGFGSSCRNLSTATIADPPRNPWSSSSISSQADADALFIATMEMPVAGHMPNLNTDAGSFAGPNTLGGAGRHPGIDIGGTRGTPVSSVAYGVVVGVIDMENGDFGRHVVIEHDINGVKDYSVYAHLDEIQVEIGTIVDENTRIGLMGNSPARLNMANHVHFETRTSLGVNLDDIGNYSSLNGNNWADNPQELQQNWVDLGPVFGYNSTYDEWVESFN